ncbi:hypothetical protein SAY87_029058 [Trapa incisa]|uniref:Uncharacterized protein n=1 Tax=Trapa incisa TaxID=236973 RepID=A0AAN7KXG4_9MYRT|nr:hypothetical protein SAY87_029058 [Trapa incisa]
MCVQGFELKMSCPEKTVEHLRKGGIEPKIKPQSLMKQISRLVIVGAIEIRSCEQTEVDDCEFAAKKNVEGGRRWNRESRAEQREIALVNKLYVFKQRKKMAITSNGIFCHLLNEILHVTAVRISLKLKSFSNSTVPPGYASTYSR